MKTTFLAVGLSYILIGFTLAVFYVFVFRRRFFGNIWGAAVVAIVGAFLGGVIDFLFHDIIELLSSLNGVINIFPPLISAAVVLSIFASISESRDLYD